MSIWRTGILNSLERIVLYGLGTLSFSFARITTEVVPLVENVENDEFVMKWLNAVTGLKRFITPRNFRVDLIHGI
jgi:hypothetical protein